MAEAHQPHTDRSPLAQQHRIEAVRHLAAGIAHEFANALTGISGLAYLMQSEGAMDQQAQRDLVEIQSIAEQAAFLARELMAFGETGVSEPSRRRLTDLVKQLRRLLPHVLPPAVRVVERLGAHDAYVWADAQQLNEIAIVLAADARDRMAGGGELLIETRHQQHDDEPNAATAPGSGPHALLEIVISGVAIGPETSAGRTQEALADAGRMLAEAGGALSLHEQPNGARVFRMHLPLAADVAPGTSRERRDARGTETILLVEDDMELADVVRRMLQTRGYRVLQAADGDTALREAAASGGPIHLLLSDVVIPGTRGLALMRRFLSLQPAGRVLFISGYEHGMGDDVPFLRKPFEGGVLSAKVREVLDAPAPPAGEAGP